MERTCKLSYAVQLVHKRRGEYAFVLAEMDAAKPGRVGEQGAPCLVHGLVSAVPELKSDGLLEGHCDRIKVSEIKYDGVVMSNETCGQA